MGRDAALKPAIGISCGSTSEYTGLPTTIVKFHKAMGFSSLFNALSSFSENDSFLHTQVCEILIYPTGTGKRLLIRREESDTLSTSVQDMGVDRGADITGGATGDPNW